MSNNIDKKLGIGNISHLFYDDQERIVDSYLHSLLFGELHDFLTENKTKVFKGISKEFTKKYMFKFNKSLKLNNYTLGPLDNAFIIEHNGKEAYEHIGFFVFQQNRGNAFGSFPAAYRFANEMYMFNHMILGNVTRELAKNTQVKFGRVVVQDGGMIEKDLEDVVNNDFYKILTG
jgi:hypothetical protein